MTTKRRSTLELLEMTRPRRVSLKTIFGELKRVAPDVLINGAMRVARRAVDTVDEVQSVAEWIPDALLDELYRAALRLKAIVDQERGVRAGLDKRLVKALVNVSEKVKEKR